MTCRTAAIKGPDVPKCPGCAAPTVKSYGCNHIQCPVCKTHWCYVCHEKFEEETIYDHLVQVHGSIGLGGVEAEEDFGEDDLPNGGH